MPRIPPELCARCKGYKRLCGLPKCPILEAFRAQVKAATSARGTLVEGATPPGILVGEHGYPKVRVYYMIPPGLHGEEARYHEAPTLWAVRREPLSRIITLRSELLSASMSVDARDPYRLYQEEVGLAAVSEEPVDSEAKLAKPPVPRLSFDGISKPRGPSAPVERIRVAGNPRLPKPAERMIWDDAPAADAIIELYEAGLDVYSIQRIMSVGFLGRLRARRVVPTRWAITAVDETISRHLREKLRDKPELDRVEVYHGEYLGNKFTIILMPGPGSIEWIEAWQPNTLWTRSARDPVIWRVEEDPLGRKTAEDGGYSAAKIAVLEYLARRGRRADVVILREITPSYYAPVGNWHIRETVRRAMGSGPIASSLALGELESIVRGLHDNPDKLLSESRFLPWGRFRRSRVTDFF